MYSIEADGSILYLDWPNAEVRREAEAERERLFGDQLPRVVDDADLVLDEASGMVRLGGLRLEYPGFAHPLVAPRTDIHRSGSLPTDLNVLHFLEILPQDLVASAELGDVVAFKVGMAVLAQTTMITDPEIRERRVAQLRYIQGTSSSTYSGTIGDYRTGNQCWVDISRDAGHPNGLTASVVSFAGPDIASSMLVVFDIHGAFTAPSSRAFVRSIIEQACGALPEGYHDGDQ